MFEPFENEEKLVDLVGDFEQEYSKSFLTAVYNMKLIIIIFKLHLFKFHLVSALHQS